MSDDYRRAALRSALAIVVVLTVFGAGSMVAAAESPNASFSPGTTENETDDEDDPAPIPESPESADVYHLTQGSECTEFSPIEGEESASEFYDYGVSDTDYSSEGTTALQQDNTSILFLYEAPSGAVSLVAVHGSIGEFNGDGGSATFEFTGVPQDSVWLVQDDEYPAETNYDNWQGDGSTRTVDWTWVVGRTVGAVLGPIGATPSIGISPAFNEDAALFEEFYDGRVQSWQLAYGSQVDPTRRDLDMNASVTIAGGPCETEDDEESSVPRIEIQDSEIGQATVPVGDPVEVTITVGNEGTAGGEYTSLLTVDLDRAGMADRWVAEGETENITHTLTFEEPGTYDTRERTDFLGRVEVTPRPSANASLATNDTVEGTVRNVPAGTTIGTSLPNMNEVPGVAVQDVNVTIQDRIQQLRFEVDEYAESPLNDSAPTFGAGFETVGFWEFSHDGDSVGNVSMNVSVQRSALDSENATVVTLRRYNDTGQWLPVAPTVLAETETAYHYRVNASRPGTFAVLERTPAITVANLELGATTIDAGQNLTVNATLVNNGTASGTYATYLSVDDQSVAGRNGTLASDERRNLSFTHSFEESGQYAIRVGNATSRNVTVEEVQQTTSTATPTPAPETATDTETLTEAPAGDVTETATTTSSSGPGFGVIAAVLGLSLGIVYRRQ